jgi:hypothetical protein
MDELKDKDAGRVISHELLSRHVEVLQDMCYQLAFTLDSPPRLTTGGLSELEDAFRLLGWDDPHPLPWRQCQHEECQRTATYAKLTPDSYRRLCGEHSMELFGSDTEEIPNPFAWDKMSVFLSFCEKDIIRWIMLLHNCGKPFDLDPTYGTGKFWTDLLAPRLKFDSNPQADGVTKADARAIPLPDESVCSIMFALPFVVGEHNKGFKDEIIRKRVSFFETMEDLYSFYDGALTEFWRLLKKDGIVVFKCQDSVGGGKQFMSYFEVMKRAERIGFYCKELFELGMDNVIWSPNMANQQHARKNHCYFIVLKAMK